LTLKWIPEDGIGRLDWKTEEDMTKYTKRRFIDDGCGLESGSFLYQVLTPWDGIENCGINPQLSYNPWLSLLITP